MTEFLRKLYGSIAGIKTKISINEVKKKVTLVGTGHGFDHHSRVYLHFGSTKDDIILNDHAEMFGSILSYNHGKVTIGEWAKLGNSTINCVNSVELGADCAISDGVMIVDHNFHPINPEDRQYMRHTPHGSRERAPMYSINAPVKIGRNVLIGANVRICKGVTIGDNTVVGANSVVTKDLPANCIAVGNPARVVKENIDKTTTRVFPLKD